jgi:hypothetical protein
LLAVRLHRARHRANQTERKGDHGRDQHRSSPVSLCLSRCRCRLVCRPVFPTAAKRSLAIKRAAYGPINPAVADTLDAYPALLRTMNRRAEADVLAARAMVMRGQWKERTTSGS